MKTYIFTLLLLLPSIAVAQNWNMTLDSGLREAKDTNRKILLLFSVPDACDACVALDERILNTEEFKAYSDHLVLVRMDFNSPGHALTAQEKAKNLLIVEKFNKDGFFPLLLLIDSNERILGKAPIYDNQSPQQYISQLKELEKY